MPQCRTTIRRSTPSELRAHWLSSRRARVPNWTPSPPRIRDVNTRYNVIYLFAATSVSGVPGTTGAVTWTAPGNGRGAAANLKAGIAYARTTKGRKIMLSADGAGNGMSFP